MKHLLLLCLCLTAGSVFALDGIFVGLGADVNANTREGIAVGGSLSVGVDFNQYWSAGIKALYSHNLDTVSAIEPAAFVRLYPLSNLGLFAQAEAGTVIFFEYDGVYPAFMGGAGVGWRIKLGSTLYVEPMVRGGYPFIWGACISAGVCFDIK